MVEIIIEEGTEAFQHCLADLDFYQQLQLETIGTAKITETAPSALVISAYLVGFLPMENQYLNP